MNRNGVIAKSALLLASLVVSLVGVEIFARIYLANALALIPRYGDSFQLIFSAPIVRQIEGSNLPWELVPNFDGYFKLTKFKTNSQGLRANREFELRKPAGLLRVALLGDSFSMPSGVEIEDAYHSVVERELNARAGRRFEFLNFAVGGYSLDNYLTVLRNKALAYQPDHVLVGVCLENDIPVFAKPRPPRTGTRRYSVMKLARPFFGYWTRDLVGRAFSANSPAREEKAEFDLDELDRILGEFKAVRDERGIAMTFALLRRGNSVEAEKFEVATRSLARHGLGWVDTGVEFGPEIEARYITTRLDTHPNALANRKFATALLREVDWGGELKQGAR